MYAILEHHTLWTSFCYGDLPMEQVALILLCKAFEEHCRWPPASSLIEKEMLNGED